MKHIQTILHMMYLKEDVLLVGGLTIVTTNGTSTLQIRSRPTGIVQQPVAANDGLFKNEVVHYICQPYLLCSI